MAEIGIIASALTVGECAGRLGFALLDIAQTLKHAPHEIAEIALDVRALSEGLLVLADALQFDEGLCRHGIFRYLELVLIRWKLVEGELMSLTTIEGLSGLRRLKWVTRKPKAKILLKKVESIKTAMTLALSIMHVAKEETVRSVDYFSSSEAMSTSNKFRRVAESVVLENRQAVEDAQRGDQTFSVAESELQSGGQLKVWRADSIDSATWLYHLVFTPHSALEPDLSPSDIVESAISPLVEYLPGKTQTILTVDAGEPDGELSSNTYIESKAIIRWNDQTKPSIVVDRLLHAWTTLTEDQIKSSATRVRQDQWLREVEEAVQEANRA